MALPADVDDTLKLLAGEDYLAGRSLATAVFLALRLGRPLLLEGEAGVGKTELAKVLARALQAPLIRLQCYEGLDIASAAYEWNIARQMLEIRIAEAGHEANRERLLRDLYSRDMLIERPLLQALTQPESPVLLIDELDRADEPFEAFLLEVLAESQLSVPEFGTIRAEHPPIVVITSNRTREIHDALKRRCLYAWVDYPDAARELDIIRRKAGAAGERLAQQVVGFVQRARTLDLFKAPGVAETIDWANALVALDTLSLDPQSVSDTLGVLLKYQDDIARIDEGAGSAILEELRAEGILERRPAPA
ncbi:MAG: MoxR family ATPase [Burkholderiaceae bacterium]|nr:MoxR family ATPase [Burkholderiaceae bacterium]